MYIAFKWLVSLSCIMWLAACIFDLILKHNVEVQPAGDYMKSIGLLLKKISVKTKPKVVLTQRTVHYQNANYDKEHTMTGLHLVMFVAGALTVSAFHKKQILISYAYQKITGISQFTLEKQQKFLKKAAITLKVAMTNYLLCFWEIVKNILSLKIIKLIHSFKIIHSVKHNKIHIVLLQKLKDMAEERKSLGQLLISAIHENKNIRMRYELETMTKNRLMQHIEDTQKQIKENRSRYVNFQQLYLITHQENNYLKARLAKLKQDNVETGKNLMSLINEVYKSNNKELKAYCCQFIVKTKNNLLNSNVDAEIKKFLSSRKVSEKSSGSHSSIDSKATVIPLNDWSSRSSIRITEILNEDDSLVPLVPDTPKLKGLPGEYVWTVKDKDGMIEKLYEYDFGYDIDNRDTIKRIRQYSVYYDKDCLLDFSKMDHEANIEKPSFSSRSLTHPMGNQKFVTGSEAFKQFLQSNHSIVHNKTTSQYS